MSGDVQAIRATERTRYVDVAGPGLPPPRLFAVRVWRVLLLGTAPILVVVWCGICVILDATRKAEATREAQAETIAIAAKAAEEKAAEDRSIEDGLEEGIRLKALADKPAPAGFVAGDKVRIRLGVFAVPGRIIRVTLDKPPVYVVRYSGQLRYDNSGIAWTDTGASTFSSAEFLEQELQHDWALKYMVDPATKTWVQRRIYLKYWSE